ncbi:MAG: calcium/sodium antiporter [Gammaproteobacteria bacterium]|nr:calcium/sodium antiporter [Gammaproteobacteria bacterium]MYF37379.1 calcium/sodium antiporter [Gammaproteobacteria bacterium]
MIWLWLILLVAGFVLLVWSADLFVEGTAALARNIGVSDLFIGLTAVSIGTSAPEIFIAITDSFRLEPDIAIGNAIGSNVANMGLVLGITALVVPLPYDKRILRSELPMLLIATVLAGICLVDLHLGRVDGILFLALFGFIMYRMVRSSTKTEHLPDELENALSDIPSMETGRASFQALIGLAILVVSSNFLIVEPARNLAGELHVAVFDVGTTIVAVGTSLPELAVTLRAALKGGYGIAIGNIVGSNMLNLLVVLSVPALMAPAKLSLSEYLFDYGVMFVLTVVIALFAYAVGAKKVITRLEGGLLLAAWIGYILLKYT